MSNTLARNASYNMITHLTDISLEIVDAGLPNSMKRCLLLPVLTWQYMFHSLGKLERSHSC